jgi:hypothetical protein
MKKTKGQTKYDILNDLLGAYGRCALDANQFWGQMKAHGWGQEDIDAWCVEYHQREYDNAREKQSGTARTEAARDARGASGRQQEEDRQEYGGDQTDPRQGQAGQEQEGYGAVQEEAQRARKMKCLVTLPWDDMHLASMIGMRRQLSAMRKNRADRYGASTKTQSQGAFDKHIFGAYGEAVISKFKNLHWNPTIGFIKKPDFFDLDGSKFQVRCTQRVEGELILHEPPDPDNPRLKSDDPDQKFYGVRMNLPGDPNNPMNVFEVTGWLIARDGQIKEKYWRNDVPWPAFFVPPKNLNQISDEEYSAYLERAKIMEEKE